MIVRGRNHSVVLAPQAAKRRQVSSRRWSELAEEAPVTARFLPTSRPNLPQPWCVWVQTEIAALSNLKPKTTATRGIWVCVLLCLEPASIKPAAKNMEVHMPRKLGLSNAAALTTLVVMALSRCHIEAFQPTRQVLNVAMVPFNRREGQLFRGYCPDALRVTSKRSRLHSGLKYTTTDNDPANEPTPKSKTEDESSIPGIFEVGGGPAVIFDDPPTEIYNKAITRTLLWVFLAAMFGVGLWSTLGSKTAEEFFAGYLVEQSLSVDNLFVFLLLFDYFKVPITAQDRVLNWGIYGSIVMRATMIGLGSAALHEFHAILLVFAGILVYSSVKVLFPGDDEEEEDMNENQIVKFSKNLIDSVDVFDGDRFFTVVEGVKKATPLFICMVAVEISDVVFAVDSIPAVFGVTEVSTSLSLFFILHEFVLCITQPLYFICCHHPQCIHCFSTFCNKNLQHKNPLIVFTSNMFAIMGLRSLYTILSKAASDLEYLEPAVAVVLGFIGGKMIAEYFGYCVPTETSLEVVLSLLAGGIGLSLWSKDQNNDEPE